MEHNTQTSPYLEERLGSLGPPKERFDSLQQPEERLGSLQPPATLGEMFDRGMSDGAIAAETGIAPETSGAARQKAAEHLSNVMFENPTDQTIL